MQQFFEKAQWINHPSVTEETINQYFTCRTFFHAQKEQNVTLYICASTLYTVYVNGVFVNSGQYEAYEDFQVYDTLDITPYLQEGNNELMIGHYVCGRSFGIRRKQIPGLIFALWSGEALIGYSDTSCEYRKDVRYLATEDTMAYSFTVEYDATISDDVFTAAVLAQKEKCLYPRPIKKVEIGEFEPADLFAQGVFLEKDRQAKKSVRMQKAFLQYYKLEQDRFRRYRDHSVSWTIPKEEEEDGVYLIFDLHKESCGFLKFTLEVEKDTEVLIGFGEHLDDLRVSTFVNNSHFCYRYVAKAGTNEFFYPYHRMGLRYLQFHVCCGTGILRAGICPTTYPLTKYPCKLQDKLHQRIYEVAQRTLELCMHDHYEDCPWREQSLYAMDSRVQMLCGYYAFQEYAFPRACLDLMRRSLREDGLLVMCAPSDGKTNIPCFTAVFVRMVLEYVQYSKDEAFLSEVFDVLKTIVDSFAARIEKNNLVANFEGYWNFYEWNTGMDHKSYFSFRKKTKEEEGTLYEAPLNAFISDAFRCFAQICEMCRPELAETYYALQEQLNRAMHQAFYHKESGAYVTRLGDEAPRHALTQGLLLFADAVPQSEIDAVSASIMKGDLIASSVSMTIYVYEALLKQGDVYREYVMKEIERVWGTMLAKGATSFWETEQGASDFAFSGSLCHAWSAVPVYIWGRYYDNEYR